MEIAIGIVIGGILVGLVMNHYGKKTKVKGVGEGTGAGADPLNEDNKQ